MLKHTCISFFRAEYEHLPVLQRAGVAWKRKTKLLQQRRFLLEAVLRLLLHDVEVHGVDLFLVDEAVSLSGASCGRKSGEAEAEGKAEEGMQLSGVSGFGAGRDPQKTQTQKKEMEEGFLPELC
jgi:hypothetical protein